MCTRFYVVITSQFWHRLTPIQSNCNCTANPKPIISPAPLFPPSGIDQEDQHQKLKVRSPVHFCLDIRRLSAVELCHRVPHGNELLHVQLCPRLEGAAILITVIYQANQAMVAFPQLLQ